MVDTPKVELELDGTWTDVTGYVRYDNKISITRGQQNEGSSALENSTCSLTLDNPDGRFSPRLPTSPYHGVLGRNTPLRVSLPATVTYLALPGGASDKATCPDAAALGVTGDIDIRIDADIPWWGSVDLALKYAVASDQRSWWLTVEDGYPRLYWSTNGTLAAQLSATSTAPMPLLRGRKALRVTLDVNNGASGKTMTFYTADTISGSWTQLGDPVTTSGTTSVFDSTAGIELGAPTTPFLSPARGRLYAFELRNGIAGTVVANPDFTLQTPGDTSFADTAGSPNTWTVNGDAFITDRDFRFWGEVSEWPPKRDISGRDATVSIQAAGISRRLKQGQSPVRSTMYRGHTSPEQTDIVAYWPLEDGADARSLASGIPGHPPMQYTGTPSLASYSGWTASDPLPEMNNARFSGAVPSYTATGETMVYFFMYVSTAAGSETSLLKVATTGTARTWQVSLLPNGNLRTSAWDSGGGEITTGFLGDEIAFELNSRGFLILKLELVQDGSDVDWATSINDFTNTDTIGSGTTSLEISGTASGYTVGRVTSVTIGDGLGLGDLKVAHVVVSDDVDKWLTDVADSVAAWNGETPADRMTRLCAEEGIPFALVAGPGGDTVTLGDQLNKPLLDLLQEAADTDLGILFEPRDGLGLAYRTRISLFNQDARLTLSCADHQLNDVLAPVDDDQRTANDVTVKRVAGSQHRAEQTEGPLSVLPPPDGVGRYGTEVTLSLEDDDQLPDQAGWRLHLGTWDEARYPQIKVNLAHPEFADADLTSAALAVDVGDRIVVTDPSADLPPDDISQIVLGYAETLDQFEHVITFNCAPAAPWNVGYVEDEEFGRVDTDGSVLAAGVDSDDTTLTVTAEDAHGWTVDPADWPFDVRVGGEVCTVTAVAASGGDWDLTVTRSVNGVAKSHSAGADVRLAVATYTSF